MRTRLHYYPVLRIGSLPIVQKLRRVFVRVIRVEKEFVLDEGVPVKKAWESRLKTTDKLASHEVCISGEKALHFNCRKSLARVGCRVKTEHDHASGQELILHRLHLVPNRYSDCLVFDLARQDGELNPLHAVFIEESELMAL